MIVTIWLGAPARNADSSHHFGMKTGNEFFRANPDGFREQISHRRVEEMTCSFQQSELQPKNQMNFNVHPNVIPPKAKMNPKNMMVSNKNLLFQGSIIFNSNSS